MPAPSVTGNPPASRRNLASPADKALTKIVDLLLEEGFGFTIPAWDGDAYRLWTPTLAVTPATPARSQP